MLSNAQGLLVPRSNHQQFQSYDESRARHQAIDLQSCSHRQCYRSIIRTQLAKMSFDDIIGIAAERGTPQYISVFFASMCISSTPSRALFCFATGSSKGQPCPYRVRELHLQIGLRRAGLHDVQQVQRGLPRRAVLRRQRADRQGAARAMDTLSSVYLEVYLLSVCITAWYDVGARIEL